MMFEEVFDLHARNVEETMRRPNLKYITWQATSKCNSSCRHCFLPSEKWIQQNELASPMIKKVFGEISRDFDASKIWIHITGGEPTLRRDLLEIVRFFSNLGFNVSMTSNGLLMGRSLLMIDELVRSGMKQISISLDGLRECHGLQRGVDCFEEAVATLKHVNQNHPKVACFVNTTVTQYNYWNLPALFKLLRDVGVKTWKMNIAKPLGRAALDTKCSITDKEFRDLLHWIKKQNLGQVNGASEPKIEVLDIGWLGREFEGMVRSSLYFCYAGLTRSCILCDGTVGACPEIPLEINAQGNICAERFSLIWKQRYEKFRDRSWLRQGRCERCSEWEYCRGGPICLRNPKGDNVQCTYLRLQSACRSI